MLLHGTSFSSFIGRDVARSPAVTHRAYVWGMPGYGLSEKSERQDISLAAQGRIFVDLLEQWG